MSGKLATFALHLALSGGTFSQPPPTVLGEAYRMSMQQDGNDLQRLQIQCSTDPSLDQYRQRADQLLNQLKKYGVKVEGRQ